MTTYRFRARASVIPDLLAYTAPKVWREIMPGANAPDSIDVLQRNGKSIVLRFNRVSPECTSVIAKIREVGSLNLERRMYEEVLPKVPICTLRYHGFVSEKESGSDWLFLEDAGNQEYSAANEQHRVLAAEWLASLHTHIPGIAAESFLPNRGPRYYLHVLRTVRENIVSYLSNPLAEKNYRSTLSAVLSQCDLLESNWDAMTKECEAIPGGLIHGDFKGGNIRIANHSRDMAILVCDWESVGWGVPLVDLAQSLASDTSLAANPALRPYWEAIRVHWPKCDFVRLKFLANLGTILRSIRGISWGACWLEHKWVDDGMQEMEAYLPILTQAVINAGWGG